MNFCECVLSNLELLDRARKELWKYPEIVCHKCKKPIAPPSARAHNEVL